MIHIRKSAMLNYIYGNRRGTWETEVADIVSAYGDGCNAVSCFMAFCSVVPRGAFGDCSHC